MLSPHGRMNTRRSNNPKTPAAPHRSLAAWAFSLTATLATRPIQSPRMICEVFTRGGWIFACAASCSALDLWYRNSICLPGPSCSTVLFRSLVLRVRVSFPSGRWGNGRSTAPREFVPNGNNVKESRPLDRRSHVGTAPPQILSALVWDRRVTGVLRGQHFLGRMQVVGGGGGGGSDAGFNPSGTSEESVQRPNR